MNGVMLADHLLDHGQSQQRVDRFVRRFQPSYRRLAYYAALPLVLTPELLNYLRNRFLRSEIEGEKLPWVAEVDLLLSDLCRQVGYEQYVMDTAVQAYLLAEMEQVLGSEEIERVARLLISYVNQLAHKNPSIAQRDRQSQQWAAMFYLADQRDIAVRQMAEAYSEAIAPVSTVRSTDRGSDRHEALWLARLTEKLAPQLAQYPGIVAYGRLVKKIVADPSNIDPEVLSQLDQPYRVLDIELPALSSLLPITVTAENLSSTDLVWKTFEFEVVTIAFDAVSETTVLPRPNFNFCSYTFEVATIQEGYQAIQTAEIALKLVENLFAQGGQRLTEIEELVLRGAIEGQTYREIAALMEDESLNMASLQRQVGNALWKRLAKILGEKVTKTNVLEVLNRWEFQRHVSRDQQDTQGFVEDFGNGVVIDLVQIPGGSFLMGSPETELERYGDESPLHEVTIAPFLLGRYTITQAQWRVVAGLPQVNRELNLDPSYFKGNDRPVEQVSWEDAVEFCDRLSQHTKREYRLPSEAEWEYACRAGTTTPFHYGETIATDLANYNGTDREYEGETYPGFYGVGSRGEYRKQTTDVDIFPANAFGLYDMHGNVWEWCLDHWHDNYEGAPTDGSAWLSEDKSLNRLLRGGSWNLYPRFCRSAVRFNGTPDDRFNDIGFRVLCLAART
jgi:formylglycine-generating enzyme required for sulfatase activity